MQKSRRVEKKRRKVEKKKCRIVESTKIEKSKL